MSLQQLIHRGARARGLDPRAVLAVASVEGGFGGAVGDHGTSYGPFQLHVGGALPQGRGNRWANSQQGINYALDQIARVARGKHGREAIAAIVRQFERPAAPGAEIQRALGMYGKVGGAAAAVPSAARPGLPPSGDSGLTGAPDKMALIQALTQHGGPDVSGLAALLSQPQEQQSTPAAPHGPPRHDQTLETGNVSHGAGGITELFDDRIGGIKNGHKIGAIGHHDDHVHVSMSTLRAQQRVIAHAIRMGLHVSEDNVHDDVDPVHVKGSYHYQHYGKSKLARAADVSGSKERMDAFYRWVASNYG